MKKILVLLGRKERFYYVSEVLEFIIMYNINRGDVNTHILSK
jgi:hypothetical protein